MRRDYRFAFPSDDAPPPAALAQAALLGFDRMPWPTDIEIRPGELAAARDLYEGPSFSALWPAGAAGRLQVQTGALMASPEAYALPLEFARGELTKLRNEAADWGAQGLTLSPPAAAAYADAHAAFRAALQPPTPARADALAAAALAAALRAQEELAKDFARHAIPARARHRHPAARVEAGYDDTMPTMQEPARLKALVDGLTIPTPWPEIAPAPGVWNYHALDWRVRWCEEHGFAPTLGPLLEPGAIPGWLRQAGRDAVQMEALRHVAALAERYGERVKRWLAMGRFDAAVPRGWEAEDGMALLRATLESLRDRVDDAEAAVLLQQPWGEALAERPGRWSPLQYAEEAARLPCPPHALRLEIAMGYGPRGSVCRSALELARLIDLYAAAGPALEIVLHYPAESQPEAWDHWRGPPTPALQADWLEAFVMVALGKKACAAVLWGDVRDGLGQRWPASGLIAADGAPRPALKRLLAVRKAIAP